MCCGLGEEHTRFRKEKKKLIVAKSGLVKIKKYLKTFNNPVQYFLLYLSRFSIRSVFIPNFRHGFWVLKPKLCDSLPQNLAQTYNLSISNCCYNIIQLDLTVLKL